MQGQDILISQSGRPGSAIFSYAMFHNRFRAGLRFYGYVCCVALLVLVFTSDYVFE